MKAPKALLLIDLQNDFCESGSLAVPMANTVIPIANELQLQFDIIIATKDWHPADHMSFAVNHQHKKVGDVIDYQGLEQVLWPTHCIQHTQGAEFHPDLKTEKIQQVIYKGTDKNIDSYSAFFDNAHLKKTDLEDWLRSRHINEIYIIGLATDYCVKYSCLDAVMLGFKTYLIQKGCKGVDLKKGDVDRALIEMIAAGVSLLD